MVDRFNLIDARWLPVRRTGGSVEWIAPWQITTGLSEGASFVELAAPRPDFSGALHEFLIGLLATAAAPEDDEAWSAWWNKPPSPEALRARLEPLAHAFALGGGGPRFMQDRDLLDADETPVAALLIDTPGDNTLRRNADLFVKRGSVPFLSRAAAAMALFTLQTYAPSGGAGHRTSLRGGGPLTTLLRIRRRDRVASLWDRLWPNVQTCKQVEEGAPNPGSLAKPIFPWLEQTRTSAKDGVETSPGDAHPLQAYWGMPRRIRLEFVPGDGSPCPLTGQVDAVVVRGYRTRPYGTNYSEGWRHPLSPYYRHKPGDAKLFPMHGQPGGVSYRHWLGLAMRSGDGRREPALIVPYALDRRVRRGHGDEWLLWVFGYDMDNMKARAWIDSEMPLSVLEDSAVRGQVEHAAEALIGAADYVAYALRAQVKASLFERAADAPGDFSEIGDRLWRVTEAAFFACLAEVKALAVADPEGADPARPARNVWLMTLRRHSLAIFDELVPSDPSEVGRMERVVRARFALEMLLAGRGGGGGKLYGTLELPPPRGTVKTSRKNKKMEAQA